MFLNFINFMVKEKFKTSLLVSVVLGAFFTASPAIAFFVGNIEVKSQFGEKFEASFEVHLDNDQEYEITIGKVVDYKKLGLTRPPLVNSLALEKPLETTGAKRVIRVFSDIPLFFPSFNLVVIAKHNGGTLLENFLVTVDFQKGLALNALGKKKKKPSVPSVKKHSVIKKEIPAVSPAKPPIAKKEILVEEKKAPPKAPEKDLPVEERKKLPKKPEPQKTSERNNSGIEPTPIINGLQNRRRLSGAIWAVPKKIIPVESMVPQETIPPDLGGVAEKKEERLVTGSESIRLNKGEGLFSVARKIKVKGIHPSRVAVALWMKNIEKFIYGNINGIQAGTELEVEGIETLAEKIDLQTAKNILNGQTKEWKITREKAAREKKIKPGIKEVPLPVERIDQVATIFDWIEGWKSSWENNDIGKHISFYNLVSAGKKNHNSEKESSVAEKKKKLFLRFPSPTLTISSQNLISKLGGRWVVFEQHFDSEAMESRGTKEVKLKWVDGNWKIGEEKFYTEKQEVTQSIRRYKEKSGDSRPFVIHVSSHSREAEAISATNKLRKNGYDAYSAPVRISKGIDIYRVYIGRFKAWEQAHRIVKILRESRLAGHATVIPYPFALQVGKVASILEARQLLEKLRQNGISGLLSISNNGPSKGTRWGVYVGAFKKPENAVWLTEKLKQAGFGFKRIRP